jgi:quinol---cytochrome c reductase iron-sulfur subunit
VRRDAGLVLGLLLLSAAASAGLFVVYLFGGQPQLEGALLGLALGGIGASLIVWGKRLLPHEQVTADRVPVSPPEEQARAREAIDAGTQPLVRRRTLLTGLGVAGAALLGALALPVRSLGPAPGRSLRETPWRSGSLVVDETGAAVSAAEFRQGQVLTVFPEGAVGSADGQAVLVRVDPSLLRLPTGRESWTPEGLVAYSKVCTHAGCPVALYLEQAQTLRCPCHQSVFSVLEAGQPLGGPAARPLPQLPLEIDEGGLLRATGDFSGPVGPSFWNMDR